MNKLVSVLLLALVLSSAAHARSARKDVVSNMAVVPIGNLASGGALGATTATVDKAAIINLAQTTSSQTVTIPTPSATAPLRVLYINNTGSVAVTVIATSVAAGKAQGYIWTGASGSWVPIQ